METYFQEAMGIYVFEMDSVVCRPLEKNPMTVCGTCHDGQMKAEAGFFWQASALMMELRLSFLMDADMEFFPGRTLRTGEAVKTYRFRLDREAKVSRSVSGILREDLSYTQFFTLFLEGLAGEETGVAVTAAEPVFRGLTHIRFPPSEAQFGDTFLTLSTCAYHVKDGRFVVVAKRVE